jgi:hypothetical protein
MFQHCYKFIALVIALQSVFIAFSIENDSWCGNKHYNLVKLQEIVEHYPQVQVPPFIGISTGRVESFLKKHIPSLFDDFNRLKNELRQGDSQNDSVSQQNYSLLDSFKNKLFSFLPFIL